MKTAVISIKTILMVALILISGCDYYSKEVKQLSQKYEISLDEAERCSRKFGEDAVTVLNWTADNKSWFFGLFSESCDDLIAQLPPFGRYENLLAAKDNNWGVNDPAYKEFLMKRNKEIAEEERIKKSKKLTEYIKRMESGIYVRHEEFGEKWPFTVAGGYLDCIGFYAIFRSGFTEYGLNGAATSNGYSSIDPIWRNNPAIPGTKIYIGDMIQLACSK